MKSRDYEVLVREIFQQLHDQELVPNVLIEHDVVKQGTKTNHQIDVYWEFAFAGITYRAAVQAKNWADPVDQGEVLKFEAVLRDLPGQPRGIMVTANGYQTGALEVAAACGIKIYELNEEPAAPRITLAYTGWAQLTLKGYRKTSAGQPLGLVVEYEIAAPEFLDLIFHADPAWVHENGVIFPPTTGLRFLPHEVKFCDAEQQVVRTLRDVYQELAMGIDTRGETNARLTHRFDEPTFLKLPFASALPLKITGLSVDVTIRKERQERLWKRANIVIFILRSLDDGNTRQFAQVPRV